MTTAYDNWLAAPYADTDEAQEQLDRACEAVTEDQIYAELEDDNLACAHDALANSAHMIGMLLKMPTIRIGLSASALATLESLSRSADAAWDERNAAIEKCAKQAIADHASYMERD